MLLLHLRLWKILFPILYQFAGHVFQLWVQTPGASLGPKRTLTSLTYRPPRRFRHSWSRRSLQISFNTLQITAQPRSSKPLICLRENIIHIKIRATCTCRSPFFRNGTGPCRLSDCCRARWYRFLLKSTFLQCPPRSPTWNAVTIYAFLFTWITSAPGLYSSLSEHPIMFLLSQWYYRPEDSNESYGYWFNFKVCYFSFLQQYEKQERFRGKPRSLSFITQFAF